MANEARSLTFVAAKGYKTRTETYQGCEHLVVPVIALVEGVVHAMNAAKPEFVPGDELRTAGWNGRPIFLGHPIKDGVAVSGNDPDLLEKKCIGTVFNVAVANSKLKMEAWIDVEKCKDVNPRLLERIDADEPIEISVGVFTETENASGEHLGKRYAAKWHDIVPDHLAILEEGDLGACSREAGCGIRAAKDAVRSKDGKYGKPTGVLNTKLKGPHMIDDSKGGKFAQMMKAARDSFRSMLAPEDMNDNDVKRKLYEATHKVDPRCSYVEAVYDDRYVYSCYVSADYAMPYSYPSNQLVQRSYSVSADGAITLGDDAEDVEMVMTYQTLSGEPVEALNRGAAAGKPCSCHSNQPAKTENDMTKEQITKFLETATPEQLAALGSVAEGKAAPMTPEQIKAAGDKVLADKTKADEDAAEEAKKKKEAEQKNASATVVEPTFEQLLEKAPAETREAIRSATDAAAKRKTASVASLRAAGDRCKFSDTELKAMSQSQLDNLISLADIKPAVDNSFGAPRVAASTGDVPAARNLADEYRTAATK